MDVVGSIPAGPTTLRLSCVGLAETPPADHPSGALIPAAQSRMA
ncbi:hypothetical protein ACFPRL_32560 [Pseudoclavibacter helvolus]